jgi:hypothetical protein
MSGETRILGLRQLWTDYVQLTSHAGEAERTVQGQEGGTVLETERPRSQTMLITTIAECIAHSGMPELKKLSDVERRHVFEMAQFAWTSKIFKVLTREQRKKINAVREELATSTAQRIRIKIQNVFLFIRDFIVRTRGLTPDEHAFVVQRLQVYEQEMRNVRTLNASEAAELTHKANAAYQADIKALPHPSQSLRVIQQHITTMLTELSTKIQREVRRSAPALERPVPSSAARQPSPPSFHPLCTIGPVEKPERIALLRTIAEEMNSPKIVFDEPTKTLLIGYDPIALKAIYRMSPTFSGLIYWDEYSFTPHRHGEAPVSLLDLFPKFEPHVKGASEDQRHFMDEADAYFRSTPLPPVSPLPNLAPDCAVEALIHECLKDRQGICIADCDHEQSSPKEFLCQYLKTMVREGVQTLFIEHLISESFQDELDAFLRDPQATMPATLATYLHYLDNRFIGRRRSESYYGFYDVVVAAHHAGIKKIVALDTSMTYRAGTSVKRGVEEARKRILCLNYQAMRMVSQRDFPGKFAIFAGVAHIDTADGVPGLAQLTGTVALGVEDAQEGSSQLTMEPNATVSDSETSCRLDILVRFTPSKKQKR